MQLKLRLPIKRQKGFTLIELLVALAITAVIGSALVVSISQVFSISIADKNRMEAVKQVENALHYINRDAQTASSIDFTGPDFPLALTWKEWDTRSNTPEGHEHTVTYSIINSKLERVETVETIVGSNSTTMIIANNISNASNYSVTTNTDNFPVLIVSINAAIGGYKPVSETRTLEVRLRPEPL